MSRRAGVYLTELEAATVDELAEQGDLTPSSVLRVGLRLLAGLPLGADGRELVELARARCTLPAESGAVRV